MSESFDNDMLERAFVVEAVDEDFDLDIPPTSGMEYLRRVQREAKQCPLVVVADIDTASYSRKQTVNVSHTSGLHPAPRGFAPSSEWQKQQIASFSRIRQKLVRHKAKTKKQRLKQAQRLPEKDNVEGWCRLCFGRVQPGRTKVNPTPVVQKTEALSQTSEAPMDIGDDQSGTASAVLNTDDGIASPPLLSIVAAMDQATVVQVLEYHLHWFEATGFSPEQGRWLYALLAVLEKPLCPETCSLLRSVARACANLRASLEREDESVLIPMNLFITLVSRYFDQTDMADHS